MNTIDCCACGIARVDCTYHSADSGTGPAGKNAWDDATWAELWERFAFSPSSMESKRAFDALEITDEKLSVSGPRVEMTRAYSNRSYCRINNAGSYEYGEWYEET